MPEKVEEGNVEGMRKKGGRRWEVIEKELRTNKKRWRV